MKNRDVLLSCVFCLVTDEEQDPVTMYLVPTLLQADEVAINGEEYIQFPSQPSIKLLDKHVCHS